MEDNSSITFINGTSVILLSFFIMSTKKMPGILIGTCILYICALREEAGNIKCTGPGTGKVYDIQILGITEAWFNETATSKLQCDHYSVVVCLPVQYASLLAVGCAENSCVNGIDAGTTEEIFGSEAGAEEIDGNQFNCLESSYDQGTAKELEPPRLPESPFFPAKELKSLKGHSAQPDQENGKITLSSGHNAKSDLGKKLKITSHPEYRKCPQLVDVTNWIVAIILIIASKKKVLQLSICFRIIVSQTEQLFPEAQPRKRATFEGDNKLAVVLIASKKVLYCIEADITCVTS
ncbi:uncharacterized protein LOC133178458 [Saccostrea echinata]|uniref:uncharacterized protein LOC133178458 n=1 Tax=Saccostrea echinata TaxID=191078 RepID=UPI002A833228|nr:uncharacterized protein LOC133178458 [Saccostrea echinata]